MTLKATLAACMGATLALGAVAAHAAKPEYDQLIEHIYVFAALEGANETKGGDEDGYADFRGAIDPKTGEMCYTLSVGDIEPTAAHIHEGKAGADGAPVVPLEITGDDKGSEKCVDLDAGLAKKIMDKPENYYVNVHTAKFPAGAVRGQLSQ